MKQAVERAKELIEENRDIKTQKIYLILSNVWQFREQSCLEGQQRISFSYC